MVDKPQGFRKEMGVGDPGTISHNVRGALGPRATLSFVAAVLAPSGQARAKGQGGREKALPIQKKELMPSGASGVVLPKPGLPSQAPLSPRFSPEAHISLRSN